MQTGILFAFLAYLAYSCSDAAAKTLGGQMSVFEIGFFMSAIALSLALLSKRPGERWAEIVRPRRPRLLAVRALGGSLGGICAVYAFTTLPLAEAYALIFLLPLVTAILSRVFLKEEVTSFRWLTLIGGLLGVLLVVRPGFRELQLGHLAALGCALSGAVNSILLRQLGSSEKRLTLVGSVLLVSTLVNGLIAAPTFALPDAALWPILLFGGLAAGIGHLSMVMAARMAPASRTAPAQYSQIVWAGMIGAALFGEMPDALALGGMVLVALFGLMALGSAGAPATTVPPRRPAGALPQGKAA